MHTSIDLEISLHRRTAGGYSAELRSRRTGDNELFPQGGTTRLHFDLDYLQQHINDVACYGAHLTERLFIDGVRDAFFAAQGDAQAHNLLLRVRLLIGESAPELHALRWETLRIPDSDTPLLTHEQTLFSRLVQRGWGNRMPSTDPPQRALVVIANPADLADYAPGGRQLAPIDVPGALARSKAALGSIVITALDSGGRATLDGIIAAMREGYDILYLVAHGALRNKGPRLWLEKSNGDADVVEGSELATRLSELSISPRLVILASCQSAGTGELPSVTSADENSALVALGPLLAAGIPAVLAMQGDISMATVERLMPTFFEELRRNWQPDQALAVARGTVRDQFDWWMPVLFLRGQWQEPRVDPAVAERMQRDKQRRERLALLVSPYSRKFFDDRRASFVGRVQELDDIRKRIAVMQASGGYVTITGQAGQGKSSVIARLIEDQGEEESAYYFIQFSPGPDEQINLLQSLIARLMLKYDLLDLADAYLPSNAQLLTLQNSLIYLLDELCKRGVQETLYIDGLDQIKPDLRMGERDLSFLPLELPAGIVIVIGTRPDDTLRPLEVRAPQQNYSLPALSLPDFEALLRQRGVTLAADQRTALYEAVRGNAFDLDFVARQVQQTATVEVTSLLERIRKNPQHLFGIALNRLRSESNWTAAIKPMLGCLLATVSTQPLSEEALAAVTDLPIDQTDDALLKLGGFLGSIDRDGLPLYYLYHLKLIDYLQDSNLPAGQKIFNATDMTRYHARLIDWCEGGQGGLETIWQEVKGHGLESERRAYARQHYVAHLAGSRNYERLWAVLDAGDYGRAKLYHDPSTRAYTLDLDIGRQVAIDAGSDLEEGIACLPQLWHYSLLRTSLASQADNFSDAMFKTMVLLGREQEAIGLAELLTDTERKVQILVQISMQLVRAGREQEGQVLFGRGRQVAYSIEDGYRRENALGVVAAGLAQAQQFEQASTLARSIKDANTRARALGVVAAGLAQAQQFEQASTLARSIKGADTRAKALGVIAVSLAQAEEREAAVALFNEASAAARSIEIIVSHVRALGAVAAGLAQAEEREAAVALFNEASAAARSIKDASTRASTLGAVAADLAKAQQFEQASTLARSIKVDNWRARALRAVAESLAQAEEREAAVALFNEASAAARSIEIGFMREKALGEVAESLAQAQQFEQASTLARSIKDADTRVRALGVVAAGLAQAEEREAAVALFNEVSAAARSIEISFRRAEALGEVAESLAQAQQFEQASTLARSIEFDDIREKALGAVAVYLAQAQQFEQASTLARSIKGANTRAEALGAVAESLAQAQQFEQASTLARSIKDANTRARALGAVAAGLAQAQQFEQASTLARSIKIGYWREKALGVVAAGLAQAEEPEAAVALFNEMSVAARSIKDANTRVRALGVVAAGLAQAEEPEAAVALFNEMSVAARSIKGANTRAETLGAVAESLAQAQQFEQASTLARSIKDAYWRAETLRAVAESLAQAQQFEQASTLARSIEFDHIHEEALGAVAVYLAQAQQFEQASTLARSIKDDDARAWALRAVAQALVHVSNKEQLLQLVQQSWLEANTRSYLLKIFPLFAGLVAVKPDLPSTLIEGITWVDAFLKSA